ncbi:MAG: ribosome silencing factor [Nitrospiraceae bacterium]|nr:ribosome silencing factor [Nitrospiraceae bacterium]
MAKEKKNPASQGSTKSVQASSSSSRDKAIRIASLASDKKAYGLVIMEMKDLTSYADYFVICTAESSTQIKAISDNIIEKMKEEGQRPSSVEGLSQSKWVLLDYADVIVHIFDPDTRLFYDLEKLWLDAPRIEMQQVVVGKTGAPGKRGRAGSKE